MSKIVGRLTRLLLTVLPMVGGCRKSKLASVPPSAPRIVGFWTLEGGDYALTNEYRKDGTCVQHVFGRTTEPHAYRIEGEFLINSVPQPDGTVDEQKEEFRLTDDTLTFIDSPTSKRVFRRSRGG